MNANMKSLKRGLYWIISLSSVWLLAARFVFGLKDPISLAIGIIAIIFAVGIAGYEATPIQHRGVPKIFGKRKEKPEEQYSEGPKWLRPGETVEDVSIKDEITDVPVIQALSINKVPMKLDAWVRWRVVDSNTYLNLESPKQTVDLRVISICNDAGGGYIERHTDEECEQGKGRIQKRIQKQMEKEITRECGIEIIGIDIRPVLPVEKIIEGLAEDKIREINVARHNKSVREIGEANPDLKKDAKALANTSLVVEGRVKKTIEEKTQKIGVEPETLIAIGGVVAQFLKKDNSEDKPDKGGKK